MANKFFPESLIKERKLAIELLNTKAEKGHQYLDTQSFNISNLYADLTQEVQLTPKKLKTSKKKLSKEGEFTQVKSEQSDFKLTRNLAIPNIEWKSAINCNNDLQEVGQTISRVSILQKQQRSSKHIPNDDKDFYFASTSMLTEQTYNCNKMEYSKDWLESALNDSQVVVGDDEFNSGADDKAISKILRDQYDWEKEFVDIPTISETNFLNVPDAPRKMKSTKYVNLEDFSGYLEIINDTEKMLDDSRRNLSLGEYFLKNSDTIKAICPKKTPPKNEPVPLVDTLNEHSWLRETSNIDNAINIKMKYEYKKENKENLDVNNISAKTLMKFLHNIQNNDSPKTVLKKYDDAKYSTNVSRNISESKAMILSSTMKTNGTDIYQDLIQEHNLNEKEKQSNFIAHISKKHPTEAATSTKQLYLSTNYRNDISRVTSQYSVNSHCGSTKALNVFPIKTSCKELIWNSVKLQERVAKQVAIKNNSDKNISVMISISGPGFQCSIIGKQKLGKLECRSFTVDFCPTVKGPAVGLLTFTLSYNENEISRNIHLFGHGGTSIIKIKGLETPPSGDKYLCMGSIYNLTQTMEKYIEIGNRGEISGFCIITVEAQSKLFNSENFMPSKLVISPCRLILPTKRAGSIKISFTPTLDEARCICDEPNETVVIAKINVIYGDLAMRERIKCLTQQISIQNPIVSKICEKFTNESQENLTKKNFEQFLDNPTKALQNTLDTLKHVDFVLTISKTTDESFNFTQAIGEHSIMFKSMFTDAQDNLNGRRGNNF